PPGMDTKIASVIPVTFGTADDCLFEFGHLKKGETALIQAGASGVGVAAIQLAKRAGATVIATASSDERLEKLKPLGLDHGINYRTQDVLREVMQLTGNRGVDVVVDPVGSTLQTSIACLAQRGRVSLVGQAGRAADNMIDPRPLMMGNKSLTGVFLGAEIAGDRAHDNIQRLINDVAKGDLKVVIDKVFPLREAAAAHAYIESRAAVGRVVMVP
ncbi:MAG TPA: zinc-binding dehydrogenase, partial [Rhizomicrobium sp.]|nr:zinc-binding dehydrogenase [Rhizomicrobium sp.]